MATGPQRIWNKKMDAPGLAMSRSIGDFFAHTLGCICDPEIYTKHIENEFNVIVLATDGVWEVLTNIQVATIIHPFYENGSADFCQQAS